MTYRFEHDPESGAFYIRVREGEYHETIPLEEPGFGAGVDVDAEGNVLGFEFLSFAEYGELVERAGGFLEVSERLAATPDVSGADDRACLPSGPDEGPRGEKSGRGPDLLYRSERAVRPPEGAYPLRFS